YSPSEQDPLQRHCSITTVYTNIVHQSKSAEDLHNLSLQTCCFKPYKLKYDYYKPKSSGVALVTLYIALKRYTLPKGSHVTRRHSPSRPSCSTVQNRPAHEARLQQGLSNPEYEVLNKTKPT
ncbi:MAG TPA: hypothetical protein VHA52_02130, partial [Candidatus Babeliaceae bacterium]|nr:hypothetical protein [Candidatus Babeliaceae bacterium]